MITYPCPNCRDTIRVANEKAGTAFVCPLCNHTSLVPGERLILQEDVPTLPPPPIPQIPYSEPISPTRVIGGLLLFFGLGIVFFFFLVFDASVPVDPVYFGNEVLIPGGRVNNLGLMEDRQNGLIIGSLFTIIGVVLSLLKKD